MISRLFKRNKMPADSDRHGQSLWLLAGLGNPGKKYIQTWHNCGFRVLDILVQRHQIPVKRIKHKSLIGQGEIRGVRCMLQRPSTFMNQSGEAVREAVQYLRLDLDHCLIIYDDIDLPVGQIRLRPGGGPGTHNGMRSIISCLGEDAFPRLRIGIGPKPLGADMADYVLSDIPSGQKKLFDQTLNLAADAVEILVTQGLQQAMAEFNRR